MSTPDPAPPVPPDPQLVALLDAQEFVTAANYVLRRGVEAQGKGLAAAAADARRRAVDYLRDALARLGEGA